MKRTVKTVEVVTLTSETKGFEGVSTCDENYAPVIEWADANPIVWKIVTGTRSKVFGRGSSEYIGCSSGSDSLAVLYRLAHFKKQIEPHFDPPASTRRAEFWEWRARFTLEHYADKGFRGGLFQQWDGKYHRGCTHLDYTPETLSEVIDRFLAWCAIDDNCKTVEVRIDGKTAAFDTTANHVVEVVAEFGAPNAGNRIRVTGGKP